MSEPRLAPNPPPPGTLLYEVMTGLVAHQVAMVTLVRAKDCLPYVRAAMRKRATEVPTAENLIEIIEEAAYAVLDDRDKASTDSKKP